MRQDIQSQGLEGWKLEQRLESEGPIECWQCSLAGSQRSFVAKILKSNRFEDVERFEREVYLRSSLPSACTIPSIQYDLDASRPFLIVPKLESRRLDEWLAQQSMPPPRPLLMWMSRQLLQALHWLHQLGYVHIGLQPRNILVGDKEWIRLDGLSDCRPVGEVYQAESTGSRYNAPELSPGGCELSSAQDIYSLAILLSELFNAKFLDSPLAQLMLAQDPEDRPTAGELLPLFLDLEKQLFGQQIAA